MKAGKEPCVIDVVARTAEVSLNRYKSTADSTLNKQLRLRAA